MTVRSIFSEALRNIASCASHALLTFLVVLFAGSLLGGYEAFSILGLEREAVSRVKANADVKTVVGGEVDGLACDRLAATYTSRSSDSPSSTSSLMEDTFVGDTDKGSILSSGAMRSGPQVTPASTAGKDIATYEVTPGLLRLLSTNRSEDTSITDSGPSVASFVGKVPASDASGIWVSTTLAHDFGLVSGSEMQTNRGDITIAGIFSWPNDGRDTRLGYALVVPVSPDDGAFEECWAKQWPQNPSLDSLLLSTVVVPDADTQGSAGVTGLNKGFDSHYDAHHSYVTRMTIWIPLVALVLGMVIGSISVRRRRLEYAGALHSGQSKAAQLLEIGVETCIWAGLATFSSGCIMAAVCTRFVASGWLEVFQASVRSPLSLFAGIMVTVLCVSALIRESQLFKYFKSR